MNAQTVLRMALRSLWRAPVRSALTALGVIVGVAAVVATTSIGSGAKTQVQEMLTKPETRTIHLSAMQRRTSMNRVSRLDPKDGLTPDDYYEIRGNLTNVTAVSPRIYLANGYAQGNGRASDVAIEGIDVGGFLTVPRTLLVGSYFTAADVKRAAAVCVISESLARTLFPGERAHDRQIRINDLTFRIVGVVDDVQAVTVTMFRAADLHVYMPFTSLIRRLDPNAMITINAQAKDIESVGLVQEAMSDIIERRRSARKADFRTSNAFESLKTYSEGSLTVARLLAAIGAIALVVGGIGIMNIMLVSVTERTREIGIRMAVGMRSRHILNQFLSEAVALSLIGGCIGVAGGWTASAMVTRMNGWPTQITLESVLTALVCSGLVGIFFGWYPARRAAELNPVEALRTE